MRLYGRVFVYVGFQVMRALMYSLTRVGHSMVSDNFLMSSHTTSKPHIQYTQTESVGNHM